MRLWTSEKLCYENKHGGRWWEIRTLTRRTQLVCNMADSLSDENEYLKRIFLKSNYNEDFIQSCFWYNVNNVHKRCGFDHKSKHLNSESYNKEAMCANFYSFLKKVILGEVKMSITQDCFPISVVYFFKHQSLTLICTESTINLWVCTNEGYFWLTYGN